LDSAGTYGAHRGEKADRRAILLAQARGYHHILNERRITIPKFQDFNSKSAPALSPHHIIYAYHGRAFRTNVTAHERHISGTQTTTCHGEKRRGGIRAESCTGSASRHEPLSIVRQ